jgi:hypothetical protein
MAVQVRWNGAAADALSEAAERGVFKAAEVLLEQAVAIAPFEEGPLTVSGKATADGAKAAVSFNTPYAVIQHEAVGFRHPNGRQAKYLEQPANSFGPEFLEIVGNAIRGAI